MKKLNFIFGVFIAFLILSACSKDDNNSNSNQDPIIGVWKPVKEVDVNFDGTEDVYNITTCHQKSRYVFSENGEVSIVMFGDYNEDGDVLNMMGLYY